MWSFLRSSRRGPGGRVHKIGGFQKRAPRVDGISLATMVFAPQSSMERSGRVFSVLIGACGGPSERPELAPWQIMNDILDVL